MGRRESIKCVPLDLGQADLMAIGWKSYTDDSEWGMGMWAVSGIPCTAYGVKQYSYKPTQSHSMRDMWQT